MAYLQTLHKKTNPVPGLPMESQLQERGDDPPGSLHPPKLTVRERQGKLFDELDLSV